MTYPSRPRPYLLVVDDDPASAKALTRVLNGSGFTCRSAGNLADARVLCRRAKFDLVVCDIELSDGCGLDLMSLPEDFRPSHGIVVSGYNQAEQAHRCLAAGFAKYLVKPVSIPRLLADIRRLLEVARLSKRVNATERIAEINRG